MELILKSAEVNLPHEIANLEQLRSELVPRLEKYKNLVVTPTEIKSAKEDRAVLNRLKKTIEEQRIEIKKQYLEPYTVLENQCKEVIRLIDEPIQAIDSQIKAFEEEEKNNKLGLLKNAFSQTEHPEWLHFESVLPQKWANKSEKTEKIIEYIGTEIHRISSEYDEISAMYADAPFLVAVLEQYRKTISKSDTLAYAVTLERQFQECQNNNTVSDSESGSINTPLTGQTDNTSNSETILTGCFKVSCTKSQLIALRHFMELNGIEFEAYKISESEV